MSTTENVINRMSLNTPERVKTRLPAESIRKTPATLREKASSPLRSIMGNPTLCRSYRGASPSMMGMQRPIIPTQS